MSFSNGDINKGSLRGTTLVWKPEGRFQRDTCKPGAFRLEFLSDQKNLWSAPASLKELIILTTSSYPCSNRWALNMYGSPKVLMFLAHVAHEATKGFSLLRVKHFYHQNVACFCRTVLLLPFVCLSFLLFSFFLLCLLKVS